MFLTGSNNFRKEIYPEYKANRKDKPLPKLLNFLREYAVTNWKAEVTDGYEADDALGMYQTEETIVCSYDKDLDMIPGAHYNWNKGITYTVSEIDGLRSFYRSLLVGDGADNIVGVDGIGKVKAARLIDHLNTPEEMLEAVASKYDSMERLEMNGKLLWIWRKDQDRWTLNLRLPVVTRMGSAVKMYECFNDYCNGAWLDDSRERWIPCTWTMPNGFFLHEKYPRGLDLVNGEAYVEEPEYA